MSTKTLLNALVVNQWMPTWDNVQFSKGGLRDKPKPNFLLFSINALALKRLTGIQRRDNKDNTENLPSTQDPRIQRRHNEDRSQEILRYLFNGFPLSKLGKNAGMESIRELQMPGWLPSSVIVNILPKESDRLGTRLRVADEDLVEVIYPEGGSSNAAQIAINSNAFKSGWVSAEIPPFEIIDGQHRLWALEESLEQLKDMPEALESFEVPVIAFHGLSTTWQAYLFYTINQLPKRIDTSLVFDLYPLLRTQDWLLRYEGPNIYRETRAQDIVSVLWGHAESPWNGRILRFGGREKGKVTQASFIRSLVASFIKSWDPKGRMKVGGLFGAEKGAENLVIPWGREQQAALLMVIWRALLEGVQATNLEWVKSLRQRKEHVTPELTEAKPVADVNKVYLDPAASGGGAFLSTDQGIRGVHSAFNDLLWLAQIDGLLDLKKFNWERDIEADDKEAIRHAFIALKGVDEIAEFINSMARTLVSFDWRLPSSMERSDSRYDRAASYRGSGGYRLIREDLIEHLRLKGPQNISDLITSHAEDLRLSGETSPLDTLIGGNDVG